MTTLPSDVPFAPLPEYPELVFGLVAPVGVDLDDVFRLLTTNLEQVGYRTRLLHLSQLLVEHEETLDNETPADEGERISRRMTAGNRFREKHGPDAMAALGIAAIRRFRARTAPNGRTLGSRVAFILRSLKRPEEVATLRRVYGDAFRLIAVTAPRHVRIMSLARRIAHSRGDSDASKHVARAEHLARRDEKEAQEKMGQQVRDTFPLADIFLESSNRARMESELRRFIEILFGHPFHTPTVDEFLMFHAWAASLRSADPSRQVGAVIGTRDGQVIAVGTNEVPKAGGGFYWPDASGEKDAREHVKGVSSSHESRLEIVRECLKALAKKGLLRAPGKNPTDAHVDKAAEALEHTGIMTIGEFGRAVHAEMAALTDAARRGISIEGQVLYCTTFPCHNCARHIVAAGIREVVYVSPYPKSRAIELHGDAIANVQLPDHCPDGRVVFRPHVGIAPRFYPAAFQARLRMRRDERPRLVRWSARDAQPVFAVDEAQYPTACLAREFAAVERCRLQKGSGDAEA